MSFRSRAFGLGLATLGAAQAKRWAPARLRGRGAILMFHHVRPFRDRGFAPNRELEITPEFLDAVLAALARAGWRLGALDEAVAALDGPDGAQPVAALTFDDGYRDFEEWALPILKRAGAPSTLFVTTGFAGGSAAPWWIVAEEALARLAHVDVAIDGVRFGGASATPAGKERVGAGLMPRLRAASEEGRNAAISALAGAAGLDPAAIAAELCLDWAALAELAAEPLVTIGAHTLTHPMLAKLPEPAAAREMADSRAALEERLGRPVRHFAYPVGTADAAGGREFALAASTGFATAVTTRPAMLFPHHRDALHALPRLSVNGRHQSRAAIDALLTGLPFAMWALAGRIRGAGHSG